MPNWCSITMRIVCPAVNDAEKFENAIELEIQKADEKKQATFLGSNSKYLFWPELERNKEEISLYGDVRWALDSCEMKEWIEWLLKIAPISWLTAEYEEGGMCIYGKYYFDGKSLTDTWLPQEFYPKLTEENSDFYYDLLEKALNKHGINEFVAEFETAA